MTAPACAADGGVIAPALTPARRQARSLLGEPSEAALRVGRRELGHALRRKVGLVEEVEVPEAARVEAPWLVLPEEVIRAAGRVAGGECGRLPAQPRQVHVRKEALVAVASHNGVRVHVDRGVSPPMRPLRSTSLSGSSKSSGSLSMPPAGVRLAGAEHTPNSCNFLL